MAGALAPYLTETLDIVQADRVPCEMKVGVEEHRAVARGEDEPIAVDPSRIGGVVLEGAAYRKAPSSAQPKEGRDAPNWPPGPRPSRALWRRAQFSREN